MIDILDINLFPNLWESLESYLKDTNNEDLKSKLYKDLMDYIDFCVNYCDKEFRNKKYTFDQVIPNLFIKISDKTKENAYKSYLRYSLYAAKLYMEKLQQELKIDDIPNCKSLIRTLITDYLWLLSKYEYYNKNSNVNYITHTARVDFIPLDIKFVANELMFIEFAENINKLDYRIIKSCMIFVIRQWLEIIGNNIIGFKKILDEQKQPINQFSQVAWKFLKEIEKKGNIIKLPIKASSIEKLLSWSNRYVHRPYSEKCYIQYYALEAMYEFTKPCKHKIKGTSNRYELNTNHGNFIILDYECLKQEFEKYIKIQRPNLDFTISWLPIDKIGAYIEKK